MPWRNLKTQFITRFFRIRHDNKILFYFNICTGLARETIIDEFYQAGFVFPTPLTSSHASRLLEDPEYLAVEVPSPA